MMTLDSIIGGVLLVILLSPVVVLLFTLFVLVPLAHLVGPAPSIARASFACPVSGRQVSAAFLTENRAAHPVDVTACSMFDGGEVRCAKSCLAMGQVGWAPSPIVARYALLADGAAPR